MRKMQDAQGLDQLIEAGSAGFFPLFYQDWIHESFADVSEVKRMSFSRAAENVHRVYKLIERHSSIERKKTAIQALKNDERKEFVLSFMKMFQDRANPIRIKSAFTNTNHCANNISHHGITKCISNNCCN